VQGIKELGKAYAPNATHRSVERINTPKCHPERHNPVIEKIVHWAQENSEPRIMWLLGPANSGKSMIAQALAERWDDQGILLATFFFSQDDPSRNHALPLFATIAYQVATNFLDSWNAITRVLELNPSVLKQRPEFQLTSLIIGPLQQVYQATGRHTGSSDPYLIIIDGLDQCAHSDAQIDILSSISKALKKCKFPLKFLISSRQEPHIITQINSETIKPILGSLSLDEFRPGDDDM